MFDKIRKFFNMGLWTADMVKTAFEKGIITEEEKERILNYE